MNGRMWRWLSYPKRIKSRFLEACAVFSLFVLPSAVMAREHKIVERSELAKFWLPDNFGGDQLEFTMGVGRDMSYGCASFGYIVDSGGNATRPVVLRIASSKAMRISRREEISGFIAYFLAHNVKYMPAPENHDRAEVFTSVTISFLGKGMKKSLSVAEQNEANKKLLEFCRIDRLRLWLGSHDVEKLPIVDVAPDLQLSH